MGGGLLQWLLGDDLEHLSIRIPGCFGRQAIRMHAARRLLPADGSLQREALRKLAEVHAPESDAVLVWSGPGIEHEAND